MAYFIKANTSELIPVSNVHVNSGSPIIQQIQGTTNFIVPLPGGPIAPDEGFSYKAAITSATIPLSYYGVNSSNDTVNITETDGTTPVTFTVKLLDGQYTNVSFISMLNTAMTDASAVSGYSFTYNSSLSITTGKISYSITDAAPNAVTINYLVFATTATVPLGLPPKNITGVATTFTALAPWLSYNVINIQGPYEIHIRSNQFPTNVFEARTQSPSTILAIIPVVGAQFQTTIYIPAIPKIFADINSRTDFMSVMITDENGILLDLNGQPVFFDLQVYCVART
jgi:hypothetical protein